VARIHPAEDATCHGVAAVPSNALLTPLPLVLPLPRREAAEPDIYLPDEGFAVRLENHVLVTHDGPMDLMAGIPIEPEEIEKLMNQRSAPKNGSIGNHGTSIKTQRRVAAAVK